MAEEVKETENKTKEKVTTSLPEGFVNEGNGKFTNATQGATVTVNTVKNERGVETTTSEYVSKPDANMADYDIVGDVQATTTITVDNETGANDVHANIRFGDEDGYKNRFDVSVTTRADGSGNSSFREEVSTGDSLSRIEDYETQGVNVTVGYSSSENLQNGKFDLYEHQEASFTRNSEGETEFSSQDNCFHIDDEQNIVVASTSRLQEDSTYIYNPDEEEKHKETNTEYSDTVVVYDRESGNIFIDSTKTGKSFEEDKRQILENLQALPENTLNRDDVQQMIIQLQRETYQDLDNIGKMGNTAASVASSYADEKIKQDAPHELVDKTENKEEAVSQQINQRRVSQVEQPTQVSTSTKHQASNGR